MSLKRQALDVAVQVAVEAACQRFGLHGACPIARELVEMATRGMEPADKAGVPLGDRARRLVRPEEKRDRLTQLTPEELSFPIPPTWPLAIAPHAVRRAIIRGMAAHVTGTRLGAPVGAGGRITRGIYEQLYPGGRRLKRNGTTDLGFVPGESGF